MFSTRVILTGILLLTMIIIGCGSDETTTSLSPMGTVGAAGGAGSVFSKLALPAGAVIESATLNLYVVGPHGYTVYVHRITEPWSENTVTWNNFNAAFDPAVENSFVADLFGWEQVDVTGLVAGWVNGNYPNYGLLLDQENPEYPRIKYNSKDNVEFQPYLEICYTLNGTTSCELTVALEDSYIHEANPFQNFGNDTWLFTGWYNEADLEKQALLIFEIETRNQGGCSHTIGYWKTHAGFGPQADVVTPLLSVWLGNAGGSKSLEVTNAAMVVDIMEKTNYGGSKNGIAKLYAQMLGAKLSIADGAAPDDISSIIVIADDYLAVHNWTDWDSLSKNQQKQVLAWASQFDDFNNGFIGPGHCDEESDEE